MPEYKIEMLMKQTFVAVVEAADETEAQLLAVNDDRWTVEKGRPEFEVTAITSTVEDDGE